MRASGAHSLSQDNETLFEFLNKNYFDWAIQKSFIVLR
jgi:hypothetical protein